MSIKRWSKDGDYVEDARIDAYLTELIDVGKRHGVSLGHEDGQGAFVVEVPSERNERWLMQAHVRMKAARE